jgi:hypothetical protein
MRNPFERGPLMAPADGNFGGGASAKKLNIKKFKSESELRAEQLELVRRWRAHQVKWNPNENGGRLRPDKNDVEEYLKRRRGHAGTGMYGSEGAAFAEYMVLEALDAEGVLGKKGSITEGYAYAYEPSDLDDILRGTDALVMYTGLDEEKERVVYPVAIDVTLNPDEAKVKQMRDMQRLTGDNPNLARVYWYDTRAEEAGEAFDEPGEGKVRALNTTVYVPGELADAFVSPNSNSAKATEALKRVGALAVDQQRWQLEAEALLLTGGIRADRSGGMRFTARDATRYEVMRELGKLAKIGSEKNNDRTYAAKALMEVLPTIWVSMKNVMLSREDERLIASTRMIDGFHYLRGDYFTEEIDAAE